MLICYVAILLLAVFGARFTHFNENYLSKKHTTTINGVFVLLIFLRHFDQYVSLGDNALNNSFGFINSYLGQLIVAPFLFYSGCGIINGILNKKDYLKTFVFHRFIPVWVSFAACILLFVLTGLIRGNEYSVYDILLSFTGWTAVGNSNWYMFAVFCLYILIYCSFRFVDKKYIAISLCIFTVLSLDLVVFLYYTKASHWWNTIMCFSLGMWYGLLKEKIDSLMSKKRIYWPVFMSSLCCFLISFIAYYKTNIPFFYVPCALMFALVIVFISMKIKVGNAALFVLGTHSFSIYMLQRIPMIVFSDLKNNVALYLIVCLLLTFIIAFLFDFSRERAKRSINDLKGIKYLV